MIRFKSLLAGGAAVAALSLAGFCLSPANGAVTGVTRPDHPATGVGSCTLKNPGPKLAARNPAELPLGQRPQAYRPDNFDCDGAEFAKPGAEFRRFPQPRNYQLANRKVVRLARVCQLGACSMQHQTVWEPTQSINPLAPYFPPFTHFVLLLRENHTFDDYLGDCATTVQAGCQGKVMSTNHISQVPDLHALAKQYALMDAYSTGKQPPSGPNHWWIFSAQSSSSSQQQSYPAGTGTQFDRFLNGTGGINFPFVMNGDFYWMLNSGSGYWRNPATGKIEALPVNRPGTSIPEELHYNEYTCCGQNVPDQTIANDYLSFVSANGLPTYSYVELFNDHPGSFQDIPTNDSVTKQIVDSIMNNASYKNNTVIVITEDDTQNGNNGPDHISNTYRVAPWSASSGVISTNSQEPPHSGSWDAWLDGYGTSRTDTLSQKVTLPAGCSSYNLSFWLHIDTAEFTTTTVYDTLKVQILNSSGTMLSTLHTYTNLNHNTGYAQRSFSLSPYAGQTITLKFTGSEDYEMQTSFVIDDTAINVN